MLKPGDDAPTFTLLDAYGNELSLSDLKGKRVVLYFYSKDNTSGCTKQACSFAGKNEEFKSLGAVVVGVSRDSVPSHQKFTEKYSLPFSVLSDPDLDAIKKYGVWQEKKNYGKAVMGVVRSTFIIGSDGKIEHVMNKVKADKNADDVLDLLRQT